MSVGREGERMKLGLMLFALCVLAQAACLGGGTAYADESHVFDPVLSLTGSCDISELDPKPDPGLCPMPPGVAGVDHPKQPFRSPRAVTTDSQGDIYVSNIEPSRGVIDIFDASGNFLTEVEDPEGPQALAVDSKGNLYAAHPGEEFPEHAVVIFEPTVYKPAEGKIDYGNSPKSVLPWSGNEAPYFGLAVNPVNDQLFVKESNSVLLLKSAAEGNGLIEEFESGLGSVTGESLGVAVDAARGRVIIGSNKSLGGVIIRVLALTSPHGVICTISGSAVPSGEFLTATLSIAVDEGTGHIFAYDDEAKKVYEFDSSCTYLSTIDRSFKSVFGGQIGIDNGENSPNGAENPLGGRYLYVPSNPGGIGHSYAFGPPKEGPPIVESVSFANVGEKEAELKAEIEPFGLTTHYAFEYVTRQQFEESGDFTGAQIAGEGDIPAGNSPVSVAAGATGLQPETIYRFRVVATNEEGSDEGEGEFATFPAGPPPSCSNEALRTGFSALLPDCRAYELVTPPSTNSRPPTGVNGNLGTFFATREASPDGNAVSFEIYGGSLPGFEATGSLAGDPYLARRDANGWKTSYEGPNGLEAPTILPGSHSPDQGYSFWTSDDPDGSASIEGEDTNYVRYPDGHSALVGRGSVTDDPGALGKLIGPDGGHIIFESKKTLEPNAPSIGTKAIYDRTPDEVTHVVSLLPGDETPEGGKNAFYEGASLDGKGVAFLIGSTLYLRYDNDETYEVGENVTFAGVAEGGSRVFYLEGGDLWRYDVFAGTRTPFAETGDVVPVNVAADGTVAYFVSQAAIPGMENPNGDLPVAGQENLYRSMEGTLSFVGTVTERDVVGGTENVQTGGLGLWITALKLGYLVAIDPSRTTADGTVLLFESRASLAGYDSEGDVEIYRYDSAANELSCLSCDPTLAPASGDASLQSILQEPPALGGREPLSAAADTTNLTPDGRRAFFQSPDALVPGDTDGLQDVYEWEAQGVGSCGRPGGCVFLISSGHSSRTDYLFAVSDSGDDVFFRTSDLLLLSDLEETPSIYDARVGGGFAEELQPPPGAPPLSPAPGLSTPGSLPSKESGNVKPRKHCPKGSKKVRRHGKVRCVKKKHHKRHHRKAGKGSKGGQK
jgi:hypothetical protein